MFYLSLISDETAKLRVPDAQFVMWNQGEWLDGGERDWNLAGLAVAKQPLEQMIAVGEWGDVLCAGSGDVHDEHVTSGQRDPAAKGPKDRGPMRGVRRIGSRIYAVGMDRQAYRREGSSRWQSFGPPGWREHGRPAPKVSEVTASKPSTASVSPMCMRSAGTARSGTTTAGSGAAAIANESRADRCLLRG